MGESMANFLYYVFIAPFWSLAGWLAGYFFPYEDDKRHITLACLIFAVFYAGIIYLYIVYVP